MSTALPELFLHEQFLARRQVFKIFGAGFHLYAPDGHLIAYSKQKAFRLKEDIRVFADEAMTALRNIARLAEALPNTPPATVEVREPASGGSALAWFALGAVVAGNALEFYDFLTFSFFAVQIGKAFFPVADDTIRLLAALRCVRDAQGAIRRYTSAPLALL